MQRPPSPSLTFDQDKEVVPVPLTDYLQHPEFRETCPEGTGQIYFIEPLLSDSGSVGYVGKNTTCLHDRIQEHAKPSSGCVVLRRALAKYGKSNFTIRLLQHNIPLEKLNNAERRWIRIFDSRRSGYNVTDGGDGIDLKDNPEVYEKWLAAHRTKEYREALSKRSKIRWATPGEHDRQSIAAKAQHKDPKLKKKHSDGVKRGWIKRKANADASKTSATRKAIWKRPEYKARQQEIRDSRDHEAWKASLKAGHARLTTQERSDRVKRAWDTRRAAKATKGQ